jgi:hypothetical protein
MHVPSSKCLFCQSVRGPFTRDEHPIPESLGNDDLILPPGTVCDPCNQYFGSKIEQPVLNCAPFGTERVVQAVRNKRGRLPRVRNRDIEIQSTGYWDRLILASTPPHRSLRALPGGGAILNSEWVSPSLLARFLLKVGLELLAIADIVTPHEPQFDAARRCARFGTSSDEWDFGIGLYPVRDDLVTAARVDQYGPLETRQIYQYGLGVMASGDVMFSFIYATSVFAINLSRPPCLEYIMGFNDCNSFTIESRWTAFRKHRGVAEVVSS